MKKKNCLSHLNLVNDSSQLHWGFSRGSVEPIVHGDLGVHPSTKYDSINRYVYAYGCVSVLVCVCVCLYVSVYSYVCLCLCVCMYGCMHLCVYALRYELE